MQRRMRYRLRAAVCVSALLVASACSSSVIPGLRIDPPGKGCGNSRILEPRCGVLWGVATQTPSIDALGLVESAVGRRFDMVYRFHELDDVVPTEDERKIAASGRRLHISFDTGASGAWRDVAEGRRDADLRRAARGIASLGVPVFVTFDHEANNPAKVTLGSPDEFVAAWRHVHDVFADAGADNVVWVWVMMGAIETLPAVGLFWPGNDYVDWISWDTYNQSGCLAGAVVPSSYESFRKGVGPFYRWVHLHGHEVGMDADKPMMISETGSVVYPNNSALTAQWYAQMPAVLERFPQIKAVGLWDHSGNELCDYRFEDDPFAVAAIAQAGQDPRVTTGSE
jgi:hypothetical protein